jgi:DNA (cytosine-5)-methyltransferase 1
VTHGELFAGISGMGTGFAKVGIPTLWCVEIDPECRRVLARHHPQARILEDVCEVGAHNLDPVDVITFGSPCQDLSVAGKRQGMAGKRSGLFQEGIRVIKALGPSFAIWENVPGAFSSNAGRDFAGVLRAFRDAGARQCGWRTLDSRWFGVAQRRRRVFVVADFRGERVEQILFEPEGGAWDSPQSDEAGTDVAVTLRSRSHGPGVNPPGRGGEDDQNLIVAHPLTASVGRSNAGNRVGNGHNTNYVVGCLNSGGNNGGFRTEPGEHLVATSVRAKGNRIDSDCTDTLVTHALTSEGADASEDGTGRGTPLVVVPDDEAYQCHGGNVGPMGALRQGNGGLTGGVPFIINAAESCATQSHARESETARCLDQTGGFAANQGGTVIAFHTTQDPITGEVSPCIGSESTVGVFAELGLSHATYQEANQSDPLRTDGGGPRVGTLVASPMMVRRLTPTECLRLQGFSDDHLDVDPPLSDAAKYRMCGNAITRTVGEWFGRQLLAALEVS